MNPAAEFPKPALATALPGDSTHSHRVSLLRAVAISLLALGFAMHNGLQVGISNHCQYLLHGLHAADAKFLENDWFTTKTPEHHHLFGSLVCALQRMGCLHQALGLMNAAASIAFAFATYFIIARIARHPLAPFAAVISLLAFMPPDGPGHSNILLPYFVPSVFAGTCLLISFSFGINGRMLGAGIAAAVAAAAHANFLLLIGPLWIIVAILQPRMQRLKSLAKLFGPWLFAWIPHIPILLTIASDPAPKSETQRIFFEVYAPLHYLPSSWPMRQWLDFLLVLIAGGIGAVFARDRFPAIARHIVIAIFLVVSAGALLIMAFNSAFVNALFPWRLAPFLTVAAYVCIGLTFDNVQAGRLARFGLPLGLIGLIALTEMDRRVLILLAIVLVLKLLVDEFDNFLPQLSLYSHAWQYPRLREWSFICTCIALAALGVRSGLWRRDIFGHREKPAAVSLFKWCREQTPAGTVFAIPPDLINFRLETGRAIVVDFKSFPLTPSDQIEWKSRQDFQAGRPVQGYDDAVEQYSRLDLDRARLLRAEYGVDFVVIDRPKHTGHLGELTVAFENEQFRVVRVTK